MAVTPEISLEEWTIARGPGESAGKRLTVAEEIAKFCKDFPRVLIPTDRFPGVTGIIESECNKKNG